MQGTWRITLFGGLRAERNGVAFTRFRTQKTAALLAYLALFRNRAHPREELAERFWPDDSPEGGRASLRTALASLRRQLEPPGVPAGAVLVADWVNVRLNPDAVSVDAAELEAACAALRPGVAGVDFAALWGVVEGCRGEFLPGFYDDWVLDARERLGNARRDLLRRGRRALEAGGDANGALAYARQAAAADPLDEEAARDLIRLLAHVDGPGPALVQYDRVERVLREETGEGPGPVLRALAAGLRAGSADPKAAPTVPVESAPSVDPPLIDRSPQERPTQAPPARADAAFRLPESHLPNLPITFTRFFGRDDEIAWIGTWLRGGVEGEGIEVGQGEAGLVARLVTLTGPGGAGKTRLAVEAARRLSPSLFGGRTWFVPLADVADARRLPGAILDALRADRLPVHNARNSVDESNGDSDVLAPVVEALRERQSASAGPVADGGGTGQVLLVLDNFEQIAEDGAPVVRALLERTPGLACLVTSRQRLEVEGEHELNVAPLPVPTRPGTPERLLEFASVQLFADRARLARPDFQVTKGNAGAVSRLCERLEGIPLALELAAARALVVTPDQMLAQLGRRLDFLVSRRRDVPARHRTLRAAIAWSYDALPPDLRAFYARLSVFRGGWDLAAAHAVCGDPAGNGANPPAPWATLDALTELRGHSLILVDGEGGGGIDAAAEWADQHGPRQASYRMLETLREFADEQLSPDQRIALGRRHLAHFLAVAEDAAPYLRGPEQARYLDALEAQHDNLRAALAWCFAGAAEPDLASGMRLASALWRFWQVRGHWREGRQHLEFLLAPGGCPPGVSGGVPDVADVGRRLELGHGLGILCGLLGDYRAARARHEECLALARAANDPRAAADALHELAVLALFRNEVPLARNLHEQGLALRRELGDEAGIALSLNNLGNLAYDQNEHDRARALYRESLALRRRLGDRKGIAATLNNLGNLATDHGEYALSRPYLEESLSLWRELGDRWGISLALGNLAEVARLEGDLARAHALNAQCLAARWELGDQKLVAGSFEAYGHLLAAEQRWSEAVVLISAAQQVRDALGITVRPSERSTYERNVAAIRTGLGDAAFAAGWALGETLTQEQAMTYALTCTYRDVGEPGTVEEIFPGAVPLARELARWHGGYQRETTPRPLVDAQENLL